MNDALLIAAVSIACNLTVAVTHLRHTRAHQPNPRQRAAIRREVEAAAQRILERR